jgi:hypothetical protein
LSHETKTDNQQLVTKYMSDILKKLAATLEARKGADPQSS